MHTSLLISCHFYRDPTDREIRAAFDTYFPSYTDREATTSLGQIRSILDKKNRYLLSVFRFDRGGNVLKTIFNAILSGIIQKKTWSTTLC
jgi:hypothetical protein